jgi:hypothetical protein
MKKSICIDSTRFNRLYNNKDLQSNNYSPEKSYLCAPKRLFYAEYS